MNYRREELSKMGEVGEKLNFMEAELMLEENLFHQFLTHMKELVDEAVDQAEESNDININELSETFESLKTFHETTMKLEEMVEDYSDFIERIEEKDE